MSREILDIVFRGEVIFGLILVLSLFGVARALLHSSAETARLRLELDRVDYELGRLHEELPAKRAFQYYYGIDTFEEKVADLLSSFRFAPLSELAVHDG